MPGRIAGADVRRSCRAVSAIIRVLTPHPQSQGRNLEPRENSALTATPAFLFMTRAAAIDDESRRFPYWRRNQLVLPMANVLCGLGFSLAWPFVPLMVRGLGVRENLETWVGYMLLVFYLVGFVVNPIWGSIADLFGSRWTSLLAGLVLAAASIAFVWGQTRQRPTTEAVGAARENPHP